MEGLIGSSNIYKNILNGITDPLLLLSKDLKIIWANNAFLNQTDFAMEEITGNYCYRITHLRESSCPPDQCPIIEAEKSGLTASAIHNHFNREGKKIFVELTAYPVKDEKGEINYFVCIYRDITKIKEAEEKLRNAEDALRKAYEELEVKVGNKTARLQKSEKKYRDLIEQAMDGIAILDKQLNIIDVNPAACQISGFSREELIGLDAKKLILEEELAYKPLDLSRVLKGEIIRTERKIRRKDGKIIILDIGSKLLEDGLIQVIFRDITEHKEAEKLTHFTNRLLELFIKKYSMKEYMDSVVKDLSDWGDFNCVGIRIIDSEGYIPYEASTGFSAEFLRLENMLSLNKDICACIRVIKGEFDPQDKAVMTQNGSLFINNSLKFIEELNEEEQKRFRANCMRHGFLSIALIPIRYKEKILGAIHLADKREGKFPLEFVNLIESLVVPLIGEAVQRFMIEKVLRESKENLSKAQHIAHLGNWIWNIKTDKLSWSDETYHIFGVSSEEELTFDTFLNYVHPEDRELVKKNVTNALYGRPYDIEHRIVLNDGKIRFVHEQGEVIFGESGEPIQMIGTVQDITERKITEIELMNSREKLRNLFIHLQTVREEERMKIAREIHDELGQALTALKIDLSILSDKLYPDHKNLVDKTESMIKKIDETIHSVKKICTELRPPILDHFGITAAIEWYVDDFKKRTGIHCDVSFEPNEIDLDQNLSTAIFRICQEALTNISRHAEASKVNLKLKLKGENISLEIKDNGKGMTDEQLLKPKSFGILGIKERINFFGGNVKINGIKGKGTYMSVSIPLKGKNH
ncbi:MAG: PAS domain S-box protein [Nitrospirae bacterium]|nr:PAS domain S-box protein [Nitrospirota bacterium]